MRYSITKRLGPCALVLSCIAVGCQSSGDGGANNSNEADAAPPDAALVVDAGAPDTGPSPDATVSCSTAFESGPARAIAWVSIPAGTFEMGCVAGDAQCYAAENPLHTVSASAFEMTDTEITQQQYESLTGENPSYFAGCDNCPVEFVDWHDASAFCELIGGRLPSEAQWEYAARAGTTSIYGCGDDATCLGTVAWYQENACNVTHPVATKAANAFGLYDLQGNVWEWVEDCWHDNYSDDPPAYAVVWEGGNCNYRVLRGGAYGVTSRGLRVSNRDGDYVAGYLVPSPGFRCVRDASALE